jgi:quinohemoprotein ethanol dehydrogenase
MIIKPMVLVTGLALGVGGGFAFRCAAGETPPVVGNVNADRLLHADSEPGAWLTPGRDWRQTYYSPLTQIDKRNVGQLGYAWSHDIKIDAPLASTPIVVDGVMFTSGNRGKVYALDAKTGQLRWSFEPLIDPAIASCCAAINRGVAVWEGKVYVAALDGQLYALDASSGATVWKVDTIIDHGRSYSSTGAPYIAANRVVIGNGGGEYDTRGYITAYDFDTGKLAWRFFTVPGDPKKGFEQPELKMAAKTWSPTSLWSLGLGGNAWDGMAYDPELNVLYVGTGNGLPWNRKLRSPGGGDQLFVSSLLAINARSGRLIWHYQTTPAESWDYDATQKPVLADINVDGRIRKVIIHAPKNGFLYVLDRRTGELLSAKPYVYLNWASHVDLKTGRPVETGNTDYSKSPKLIFPANDGGHNWQPMAFNPGTGLIYIPTLEAGEVHGIQSEPFSPQKKTWNIDVDIHSLAEWDDRGCNDIPAGWPSAEVLRAGEPDPLPRTFLRAWDPTQHKQVWQVETTGQIASAMHGARRLSGVMTTASGLVLQGDIGGYLRIFDATTGAELDTINVGTSMIAAPMTYEIDGEQYVAIMAGAAMPMRLFVDYQHPSEGRIIAFKLNGVAVPQKLHADKNVEVSASAPPPLPDDGVLSEIDRGKYLFGRTCAACHVYTERAPNLTQMTASSHGQFLSIVRQGARAEKGMPNFGAVLNEQDAKAIHAYIVHLSWKTYQCNRKHEQSTPSVLR